MSGVVVDISPADPSAMSRLTNIDLASHIFWDARHSAPERARGLGNELADRLRQGGLSVDRVLVEDLRPVPAVCAIGRPQGG